MGKIVKETKSELKKVVWPSAKDVVMGTVSVVVISGLIGLYIVLADFGSLKVVDLVMNGVSNLVQSSDVEETTENIDVGEATEVKEETNVTENATDEEASNVAE